MLSTVIVGTDQRLVNYLRQVCAEFSNIWIYKSLPLNARVHDIAAALSHYTPDVVFLVAAEADVSAVGPMLASLQELLLTSTGTAVLPVVADSEELRRTIESITPSAVVLAHPFSGEEFERAILAAMDRRKSGAARRGQVMVFLPAKPGVGATTLVLNLAGVVAGKLERGTLLIEADFRSGALPYMLDLPAAHATRPGVGDSSLLTASGWKQAVTHVAGMDVLPAGTAPQSARGTQWDFYRLLQFARERYDAVFVDLPDLVDEAADAIASEADQVFIVTTPDPPSLGLVARRLWNFEQAGTRLRRIQVILNRYASGDPKLEELEKAAGHPFTAVLHEDSRSVKDAMRARGLVAAKTTLGKELDALGRALLEADEASAKKSPALSGFRKLVNHALDL